MKHFFLSIFLFLAAVVTNAQNNIAIESQQKIMDFTNKFIPEQQLKNATANANALDSITYENGAFKEMTYNDNGQLLTFKSYKNEDGIIFLNEAETNTYNENGQMLTNVVSKYDEWKKEMRAQWKYENTYDEQGRVVSEIEWAIEDKSPYDFEYDSKTVYEYKEETVEGLQYEWDNEWELDAKETWYVRWNMGNIPTVDSARVYVLDEGTSDNFICVGVMTMKYYAPGLMSEMISVLFDEETGVESTRIKMKTSYNGNGDVLSDSTEMYIPATQDWLTTTKEEFNYNSVNQILEENYYSHSWATDKGLVLTAKNTYTYNADGNLSLRQVFAPDFNNAGEMLLDYKYEFRYKNLNTENIMIPPVSTGYYSKIDDFYELEFYKNGVIEEVKQYIRDYNAEVMVLYKTGNYHYSEHNLVPTAIEKQNNASIKVFPNPFSNEIKLQLDKAGDYQLKIRNGIGQVVYSSTVNGTTSSHNVSELAGGLYILSVFSEKKNMTSYKLIKQ